MLQPSCLKRLQSIQDVPSQRSLTWKRLYANFANWTVSWIAAQSPPVTKLARRKKTYCSCHAQPKVQVRHPKSSMHRYHLAQMTNTIFQLMKITYKSTSALARTANRNDGAMRAVLVGCLSPLPHFGSSPSELHLASRLSNKRHCLRQRATHEHNDWKSTTERTLSAPGGCFTVRVTLALFTIALVSPPFHLIFHHFVATLRCRCLLRSAFKWVVMPLRPVPCDLGDPGGGDPWFPHGTLLLHSLAGMVWWFWCFDFWWFCHTNEMIQCYHLLHQLIFRAWTGYLSHRFGSGFAFVVLGCVGFCLFVGLCFVLLSGFCLFLFLFCVGVFDRPQDYV